ncbi:uncharacterized protein LOC121892073 isoform X1 [Thunnus maccoyii]|uniref:uncharacterized protein LOC121892073 isoform X1 n=1 Tax=Thunnus maccoyii TaxID=8240 RepID=UPI001C4BF715|nr:uncharacterized protein LOC121892073 isoform X1 [Thunnus maccoyii]
MTATTSAVGHYGPFIPMKEERRQKTRRGAGTERRTVTKEYMSREDKVQGRRQEQRLGETFLPTRRHCRGVLTCASVKWISLHKMPMREEDTLSALTARLSGTRYMEPQKGHGVAQPFGNQQKRRVVEEDLEHFLQSRGPKRGHDAHDKSLHFQKQPRSKKQRTVPETVTAQGPGKSHHSHSTPKDIKKTHIGQDTNANDHDDDKVWNDVQPSNDYPESCFEMIDLSSAVPDDSSQTEPEHICHETFEDVPEVDKADTVKWDLEDDLGGADGDETVVITWNYINNEDVTQAV